MSVLHNITTDEMAEVLYESDLLISAGGTTSFQSACVGTPMVIICQTENQLKNAIQLHNAGAAITLGVGQGVKREKFLSELQKVAGPEARSYMSQSCKKICDGSGVNRVAQTIKRLIVRSCNSLDAVTEQNRNVQL
jgi:spore coat polysaccharide biosynthesis predicted glycosyltransferase SpsG